MSHLVRSVSFREEHDVLWPTEHKVVFRHLSHLDTIFLACSDFFFLKFFFMLRSIYLFIYFLVFLLFLGPLPRHLEVPRLGVKSEL